MNRLFLFATLSVTLLSAAGCGKSPETANCIATKAYGAWDDISDSKIENYCPEVADCVEQKGYGHWVGSSGISLGKFCATSVALKAIEEDKREHPENY